MNFGLRFGIGQLGGRYINSYLVAYLMDTISTDDAMDRFLDNIGSNGSNNDAVALASNHIYLNGTTQSVPYPVLHELGIEKHTNMSSLGNIVVVDNLDDTWTITGTNTAFQDSVRFLIASGSVPLATPIHTAFAISLTSGSALVESISLGLDGSIETVNKQLTTGSHYFDGTLHDADEFRMYFPAGETFEFIISLVSLKEITLPTSSYLTYFDSTTNTLTELSSTGDVGENLVVNGDFSDGLTGWNTASTAGTISNNNNRLRITNDLAGDFPKTNQGFITAIGQTYRVDVDVFIGTSPLAEVRIYDTSTVASQQFTIDGTFSIIFTARTTLTNIFLYNFEAGNTGTYCEFDNVAMIKTIPISTTYSVTDSHQFVFNHTSPLTAADVAAIEADPNLAFRMFFDGEVLPSGFSNTDVSWFSGGNEGLTSGPYIQDLSVPLGSDTYSGTMEGNGTGHTATDLTGGNWNLVALNTSDTKTTVWVNSSTIDAIQILTFDAVVNSGTLQFHEYYDGTTYLPLPNGTYTVVDGVNTIVIPAITTVDDIYLKNVSNQASDVDINNSDARELTASKIEAYDTATRTTLAKQSNGASNLKLTRDGSGRTTGTAAANTTQWEADGRTAVTNWTITAPFTITEYVGGAEQILGNDINDTSNPTYIAGDETATFTATGSDSFDLAITIVGTSTVYPRIHKNTTSTVSAGKYLIEFDAVINSGVAQIRQAVVGNTTLSLDYVLINGKNSIEFEVASEGIFSRFYFYGTSLFDIEVTNWAVKELTGADIYTFTSDGNRYKNTVADGTYTLPTGVWTLDEFGFDGVTPVTVRGKTSMVDAVVIP